MPETWLIFDGWRGRGRGNKSIGHRAKAAIAARYISKYGMSGQLRLGILSRAQISA